MPKMKQCVHCNQWIPDAAVSCHYCNTAQPRKKSNAGLVILAATFIIAYGCVEFESIRDKLRSSASRQAQSSNASNEEKYSLEINEYYITPSCRNGEYLFVVDYQFTNKDANPAAFGYTFDDKLYIDGIEATRSYEDVGNPDAGRHDTILSGKSASVIAAYNIDKYSDSDHRSFNIRVSELFSRSSATVIDVSGNIYVMPYKE